MKLFTENLQAVNNEPQIISKILDELENRDAGSDGEKKLLEDLQAECLVTLNHLEKMRYLISFACTDQRAFANKKGAPKSISGRLATFCSSIGNLFTSSTFVASIVCTLGILFGAYKVICAKKGL